MRQQAKTFLRAAMAVPLMLSTVAAPAWAYDPTPGPSPWRSVPGADVEAGNTNTQTADKVLQAKDLIKKGQKYRLGHEYKADMPLFPGNAHAHVMNPPMVINRQIANGDTYLGNVNQNGTQFDAFGHFAHLPDGAVLPDDAVYYDQRKGRDVWGPAGLKQLGVEKIKPLFTRGILIDVARYTNGNKTLAPGTEITLDMVRQTLARQGLTESDITEGDVLLFRTGWEEHWSKGTSVYYAGAPGVPGSVPGIGLEVAQWAASKRVACVGADNWGVEVAPNPKAPPGINFPVHHELLVKNGIPHQESMHLQELSDDIAADYERIKSAPNSGRIHIFAYIFVPVPMKGGSGSPGSPLAVR